MPDSVDEAGLGKSTETEARQAEPCRLSYQKGNEKPCRGCEQWGKNDYICVLETSLCSYQVRNVQNWRQGNQPR